MNWWRTLKANASPPSYIQERISDLNHVSELLYSSPKEAKSILNTVTKQLNSQGDNSYIKSLKDSSNAILDNPKKAHGIIKDVINVMLAEKEEYEQELEKKRNKAKYK